MKKSEECPKLSQWCYSGAICLAFGAPAPSLANEYSLEYGVEAGYETNDNVRLTPDDELDISGGILTVPVTFASRSERLQASLGGEMSFSNFDEDSYDSDDQDVTGRARYQLERGEVDGYAGYKRDSTRTSEFLDTGLVGLEAVRRERGSLGGSTSYLFTQKNGIVAGIDYEDVEYGSLAYQDYSFTAGYAGWLHQWTERTQLRMQGFANWFENEGETEVESDGMGIQVGFDSEWTENTDASLLIGWIDVDTDYSSSLPIVPEDDDSGSLLLRGSLKHERERHRIEAGVTSEPRPSANGVMVENHSLDLSYRYQFTERSRFDFGFEVGQRSALDDRISNERDYARLSLRMDYRVSASWYVDGRYVYSYQDRETLDDSADSNAFYLSVSYRPEKAVWSR